MHYSFISIFFSLFKKVALALLINFTRIKFSNSNKLAIFCIVFFFFKLLN